MRIPIMSMATMVGATACGWAPSVAWAAPITVEFEGHMTWVDDPFDELDNSFFYGAPLQGGFIFDPEVPGPDLLPNDPNTGAYSFDFTLWMQVGSLSVAANPLRMAVINSTSDGEGDDLFVAATNFDSNAMHFLHFVIHFQGLTSDVYDDTTVPDSIDLDDFFLVDITLRLNDGTPGIGGLIEELSIIPEPSTVSLMLLGLTVKKKGTQLVLACARSFVGIAGRIADCGAAQVLIGCVFMGGSEMGRAGP